MKNWLEILYPDAWVSSTYKIPFEKLYKKGYRGVIFDIDNTLVPHGAPADERAEALFAHLKELGFEYALISNNKGPRVQKFNENIHAYTVCDAHKPNPENYLKAAAIMGLEKDQVVFVGDQIFTDVLGAKIAGIFSILVQPIHPKEEIQIVLKRKLERIILKKYKIKRRAEKMVKKAGF